MHLDLLSAVHSRARQESADFTHQEMALPENSPSKFCYHNCFGEVVMPQFVIEREIPGAGSLSDAELQAVAKKSVGVLKDMGAGIKWLHSYVTGDKIYCVYQAPDEETVREHARRGGFPANRISAVRRMIDPDTAT
jgi:hypothetical protein